MARRQLTVRDGQGAKDRVTMVPEVVDGQPQDSARAIEPLSDLCTNGFDVILLNYTVAPDGERLFATASLGGVPHGIWEYDVRTRALRPVLAGAGARPKQPPRHRNVTASWCKPLGCA